MLEILYSIAFFGDPEEEVGEEHYGLYWEPEIPELFDTIPYPWQEFFKVGDKVEVRKGQVLTITEVPLSKAEERFTTDDGGCSPLWVIKVGEAGKETDGGKN